MHICQWGISRLELIMENREDCETTNNMDKGDIILLSMGWKSLPFEKLNDSTAPDNICFSHFLCKVWQTWDDRLIKIYNVPFSALHQLPTEKLINFSQKFIDFTIFKGVAWTHDVLSHADILFSRASFSFPCAFDFLVSVTSTPHLFSTITVVPRQRL